MPVKEAAGENRMGIPAGGMTPDVFLKEHLLYVHTKAEAGEYTDAMAALRETRASVTDNVYLGALEKQLRQLIDLSEHRTLSADQRSEILEPLSGIIEKALGSVRQSIPVQPLPVTSVRLSATLDTDERQQALDRLKVQYFEQASRHLSAGEYDLALSEIRRVFVIDPDNSTAKQYESVIGELMHMKPPEATTDDADDDPRPSVQEYERGMEQVSIIDNRLRPGESPAPPDEDADTSPDALSDNDPEEPAVGDPIDEGDDLSTVQPFAPPAVPEDPAADAPALPVRTQPLHVFTPARTSVQTERPRRFPTRLVLACVGALIILGSGVTLTLLRGSGTDSQRPNLQLPVQSRTDAVTPATSAATQPPEQKESQTNPSTTVPESGLSATTPILSSRAALEPTTTLSRNENPGRMVVVEPVAAEEVAARGPVSPPPKTEAQATTPIEPAPLTVAEPEPEPFIAVEKEPQIAHFVQPQIPDVAWQAGNEASIVVRVLVNPDGKAVKTKILKSTNAVVESAVVAALMQSTYTPGIMGKSAVTSWLTVPLKFKRAY
jgi:periplasmic protein TonB